MSAQAAAYAQDYAWEKIAKQIVEVYEELANQDAENADSR
jgi:glycosyltransferase involved in cell wall biosynthesis